MRSISAGSKIILLTNERISDIKLFQFSHIKMNGTPIQNFELDHVVRPENRPRITTDLQSKSSAIILMSCDEKNLVFSKTTFATQENDFTWF